MNVDWDRLPRPLVDLLRGYATLCPPRALQFPKELPFQQVHDFFLNCVLLNPYFTAYPPAPQYQQQFWKWAIKHLEDLPNEKAGGL